MAVSKNAVPFEESSSGPGDRARLLVVDDEPSVQLSLTSFFTKQGFTVEYCGDGSRAIELLQQSSFDVVLIDLLLPDMNGMEVLAYINENNPDVAVVVMSAAGTIETAVQAVKSGAEDFFKKPFVLEEAALTLRRTLELRRLQRQNVYFQNLVRENFPHEMLGKSKAMDEVRSFIDLMAENGDTTVLIEGESGVGKGMLARSIHERSIRKEGAFVEINCSSLSENLLESELFGYEKGAFTGATSRKPGLYEVADGGTLFLDEISDMPLSVQPKLLTSLETGRFRRLGGTCDLGPNVRIIASSNRPMKTVVKQGKFREDLYYRLNVMRLEIPPLRERKLEDVPVLTEHFLSKFVRARGRDNVEVKPETMELLLRYEWPGNLRELRNVLERAVILARGGAIAAEHLPRELAPTEDRSFYAKGPLRTLQDVEVAHIKKVLEATGHNHSRSARILGLHRTTLLDKIKKFHLED